MIKLCPHCNKRFMYSKDCDDFVHTCNSGNSTLDNDDVFVLETEIDGVSTGRSQASIMMQGLANKHWGTDAGVEGERGEGEFTKRGNRAATHVAKQHKEYIDGLNE